MNIKKIISRSNLLIKNTNAYQNITLIITNTNLEHITNKIKINKHNEIDTSALNALILLGFAIKDMNKRFIPYQINNNTVNKG